MSPGLFAGHPVPFDVARGRGVYRARLLGAVDGDTVAAVLDLGCEAAATLHLRVAGVDAAERRGGTAATRAQAEAARAWCDAATRDRWAVVRTRRRSFARYVADVWLCDRRTPDGRSLGDALVAAGMAVRVDGES